MRQFGNVKKQLNYVYIRQYFVKTENGIKRRAEVYFFFDNYRIYEMILCGNGYITEFKYVDQPIRHDKHIRFSYIKTDPRICIYNNSGTYEVLSTLVKEFVSENRENYTGTGLLQPRFLKSVTISRKMHDFPVVYVFCLPPSILNFLNKTAESQIYAIEESHLNENKFFPRLSNAITGAIFSYPYKKKNDEYAYESLLGNIKDLVKSQNFTIYGISITSPWEESKINKDTCMLVTGKTDIIDIHLQCKLRGFKTDECISIENFKYRYRLAECPKVVIIGNKDNDVTLNYLLFYVKHILNRGVVVCEIKELVQ